MLLEDVARQLYEIDRSATECSYDCCTANALLGEAVRMKRVLLVNTVYLQISEADEICT